MSMNPVLTIAEVKAQFPSQWVLLDDLEVDQFNQVMAGRVIFHSSERDEVYAETETFVGRRFAVRYTGPIPADGSLFALCYPCNSSGDSTKSKWSFGTRQSGIG